MKIYFFLDYTLLSKDWKSWRSNSAEDLEKEKCSQGKNKEDIATVILDLRADPFTQAREALRPRITLPNQKVELTFTIMGHGEAGERGLRVDEKEYRISEVATHIKSLIFELGGYYNWSIDINSPIRIMMCVCYGARPFHWGKYTPPTTMLNISPYVFGDSNLTLLSKELILSGVKNFSITGFLTPTNVNNGEIVSSSFKYEMLKTVFKLQFEYEFEQAMVEFTKPLEKLLSSEELKDVRSGFSINMKNHKYTFEQSKGIYKNASFYKCLSHLEKEKYDNIAKIYAPKALFAEKLLDNEMVNKDVLGQRVEGRVVNGILQPLEYIQAFPYIDLKTNTNFLMDDNEIPWFFN